MIVYDVYAPHGLAFSFPTKNNLRMLKVELLRHRDTPFTGKLVMLRRMAEDCGHLPFCRDSV